MITRRIIFTWIVALSGFACILALYLTQRDSVFPEGDPQTSGQLQSDGRDSEERDSGIPKGHAQMLRKLRSIREDFARHDPFWTNPNTARHRERLRTLPATATDSTRGLLHYMVGRHDLYLGHTRQAVDHMSEVERLLPDLRATLSEFDYTEILFRVALAYLRKAETDNCVCSHTAESCLLPIRGGGIHQQQDDTRSAIAALLRVLEQNEQNLTARWLLNIAFMSVGEYPDGVPQQLLIEPEAFNSEEEFPVFRDIAAGLGLNPVNLAGGTIVDDFDTDGLLDIVTSTLDPSKQIQYFHNDGDGTFSEGTDQSCLTGIFGGLNLVQADYNNDGHTDVLVLRGGWLANHGRHPNSLLRNNGHGVFTDVTIEAGLSSVDYPSQTASWADFDLDGDLDLYIGNEGFPCQLFQNDGDGRFHDIAADAGVANEVGDSRRVAKGVIWGDYDDDGFPDIYVSNYGHPNRLYRNQGDGSFRDVAPDLGVTRPTMGFPVWFWDHNNDGALDLFASSFHQGMQYVAADYLGIPHDTELDCLYENDGKGGFVDRASELGLGRVTQPMGSNFGDLDNDGYLDFYLGTGYPSYEALMPNLMFRNRRGHGFSNVTTAGGFGHLQKGHGVAFADFDNDGDQDIYLQVGGFFPGDQYGNALFENPGFGNNWVVIKLNGVKSNRSAIGARIRLEIDEDGERREIHRRVNSGGSFGASPLRQHIGLGTVEQISRIEVYWPASRLTQTFRDVSANQMIEIDEFDDQPHSRVLDRIPFVLQPDGSPPQS